MKTNTLYLKSVLLLALAPLDGAADVVRLDHGGTANGQIVRGEGAPRGVVVLRSEWGTLQLKRTDVSGIQDESPAEAEYRRRAPAVSNTVVAQMALVHWCRDNGLGEQLRVHAKRVLDLDPNHEEARLLLGYQLVGGEWLTRDERLARRGMLRHQGEHMTHQEVELAQRTALTEEARRDWSKKIKKWRNELGSSNSDVARAASSAFTSINDPLAIDPLVRLTLQERDRQIKPLLIRSLGQTEAHAALRALVQIVLEENDPEFRAAALEQLTTAKAPGLAAPFVVALGSSDNRQINRAAEALSALGDSESVKPLVSALISVHKTRVGNDSQGDTYSFNTATGTHSFGGGGAKVVRQEVKNPSVLSALVELTGVNFLYDQQAWRAWLASQQHRMEVDLRRDP